MTQTARSAARPRLAAAAALLAGVSLFLSACADGATESSDPADPAEGAAGSTEVAGETPSDAVIYEFEEAKVLDGSDTIFNVVDQPVTIRLSDELKSMVEVKDEFVPVESFTVSSKSFATGICRTDVQVAYLEGGKDVILDEWASYFVDEETSETEAFAKEIFGYSFTNAFLGEYVEVDELPSDEEIEENTFYFTADREQATLIQVCGAEDYFGVQFPFTQELRENKLNEIAELEIYVDSNATHAGGHVTSLKPDILSDAVTLSPAGTWEWGGKWAE